MRTLTEGTTSFVTEGEGKISKELTVFYNPVMRLNRDLSLVVLSTMTAPRICLPMEASGVRAARILHELVTPGVIDPKRILINDISPTAIRTAKKNVAQHKGVFPEGRITWMTTDANLAILSEWHDYIDIDPFGTPNPFLDSAVRRLARRGIIAVTATDTSALAGTYPHATLRKYWSVPSRTWVMHEMGLRILIRKVQLVAAQHDIPLTPILSVSTDHYYRIFFRHAGKVQDILFQHRMVDVDERALTAKVSERGKTGPLWVGPLHDAAFVDTLHGHADAYPETKALLGIIAEECRLPGLGFVDLHLLAQRLDVPPPPRDELLHRLGQHGSRTHLSPKGIRTDLSLAQLKRYL